MAVLYQTYRPQRFADVKGQDPIVRVLRNAIAAGNVAHAYLFTGSRGVGKTTLARLLAKAVNCPNQQGGDPCGACEICIAIASGTFLDVIEIDAASHTGVDNVRELIEHMQFKPAHGKMKVFIIDEVHMLSKAAFNALLKTLEEPPAHAMFILATTDIEKVPETIISRTQRLDFRRFSDAVMMDALAGIVESEALVLPTGTLEAIVQNADGAMRDALSLLGTAASLGSDATIEDVQTLLGITPRSVVQQLITSIGEHAAGAIPEYVHHQLDLGVDFIVFNRNILEYLRELLIAKVSGTKSADETFVKHLALFTVPQLLFVIRLFLRAYKESTHAPSVELPILLAAIEASLQGSPELPAQTAPAHSSANTKLGAPNTLDIPAEQSSETKSSSLVVESPPIHSTPTSQITEDNVDISEVLVWWPDVINRIKLLNSPLSTLLKNSPVKEVSAGQVVVRVKYLFHKENIDSKKNAAMIQETIALVSGKTLGIKAIIDKSVDETPLTQTVDALTDAIKVFGGELVE